MRSLLFLAWRNLMHHRLRSLVLVLVLTIVTSIPVLANLVVSKAENDLTARARTTPLVYGAQGSQIELVLSAAYFNGASTAPVPMAEYQAMIDLEHYDLVPLRMSTSVRGHPLVGIDHEYFRVRDMELANGNFPLRLGEIVLGSEVAARLNAGPGDEVSTDVTQAFDLAGAYPVILTVTGVLVATGTPDDRVVFTDLSTAWVAEGIGHGHQELDPEKDRKLLLNSQQGNVVANASVLTYTTVSNENRNSFHYHGATNDLPLSSILVFPRTAKSAALLKGRVSDQSEARQVIQVDAVVEQLLTRVFQVKSVLQNVVATMGLAALAALTLVVTLSVRMRQREFEIANQIGAQRQLAVWLVVVELTVVLLVALVLTALISGGVFLSAPQALLGWVIGGNGT